MTYVREEMVMTERTLYIITNQAGDLVATAQEYDDGQYQAHIYPGPEQKMYRIRDVPEEIMSLTDPGDFHRELTKHFKSPYAKISEVDFAIYIQTVFAKRKPENSRRQEPERRPASQGRGPTHRRDARYPTGRGDDTC